jgi:hypothetical protein
VREESRGLRPVLFIALGLVLIVVTAVSSLFVLHRRDEHADLRARQQLAAATFVVQAVGVATSHRVAVVVTVSSAVPFTVVDATVAGEGWQVTHDRAVGLSREVDCFSTARPPDAAEAVVELHGQRRTVDLLTDSSVFDVVRSTGREACGDLDAGKALNGRATVTTKAGAQLSFDLTLSNRSVHAVMVRGFALDGTHVMTSQRLPFPVAPRSTRKVHLVITLAECLGVGQVGSNGAVDGLEVEVRVTGKGGAAAVRVGSTHLQELVEARRRERCR